MRHRQAAAGKQLDKSLGRSGQGQGERLGREGRVAGCQGAGPGAPDAVTREAVLAGSRVTGGQARRRGGRVAGRGGRGFAGRHGDRRRGAASAPEGQHHARLQHQQQGQQAMADAAQQGAGRAFHRPSLAPPRLFCGRP